MNRDVIRIGVIAVASFSLACTVGKDGKEGPPGVPCSGCVDAASIAAGAVKTAGVADGSITAAKLAPGAVDGSALAAGSIGSTQLASGAVLSGNIAPGAVGSAQIGLDSVSAGQMAWPFATPIGFLPNVPTAGCGTPVVGGSTSGSTASVAAVTIGTMFLDMDNTDLGLRATFTRARFVVRCRGNGTLQVASSNTGPCTPVLATITCTGGGRPWTASSNEFAVANNWSLNLLATATAGTLEWSDPALILY